MIVQYNWYELNIISKLPEAHVLVIFCLSIGLDKPISYSTNLLKKKLNIENIPNSIFSKNIITCYDHGIFCNYKTNEPQCYIRNTSFVHMRLSAQTKSDYLYILSQRSIGNKNNWIPDYYIHHKYHNNPLIGREKGKITFPLENNYGKRLDTTEKTTSTRKL
jgi:transposase